MTCLWCPAPVDGDSYCSQSCAEDAAEDLAWWATEDWWLYSDEAASVRYWLDQDAMLDVMSERMMENSL